MLANSITEKGKNIFLLWFKLDKLNVKQRIYHQAAPKQRQALLHQAVPKQLQTLLQIKQLLPQPHVEQPRSKDLFPWQFLSLIKPVIMASANAQSVLASGSTEPLASNQNVPSKSSTSSVPSDQSVAARTPSSVVSNYYTDVEQIPQYTVDDVAAATKANLVVNYPNLKVLNPNEPLNRGAAAALIYQALVYQGKLPPLPSNAESSNYIVGVPAK